MHRVVDESSNQIEHGLHVQNGGDEHTMLIHGVVP